MVEGCQFFCFVVCFFQSCHFFPEVDPFLPKNCHCFGPFFPVTECAGTGFFCQTPPWFRTGVCCCCVMVWSLRIPPPPASQMMCPLTGELMEEPTLVLVCGHYFERQPLLQQLALDPRCVPHRNPLPDLAGGGCLQRIAQGHILDWLKISLCRGHTIT